MSYCIEYARQQAQEPTERELSEQWLHDEHQCLQTHVAAVEYSGELWYENACLECYDTWFNLYTISEIYFARLAA